MAYILADNIISPLGDSSEANYLSVKAGKSGIRKFAPGECGIPEGFTASLMHADFESLAWRSAHLAMLHADVDVSQGKSVFILSSTKGDVEHQQSLADTARRLSERLGFAVQPIVVCNACISGLAAMILGSRLIASGKYDYAVVCGCDTPAQFIISGFQSLKALSSEPCRPFDMERFGLNLGEAAATVVLGKQPSRQISTGQHPWHLDHGYIKNDAFHISAPSKTSEGLCQALMQTIDGIDLTELAFVNTHGTATLFNDQMESIALQRAGLSQVPTNALKGYFGHTLGAAGVLETVLSMKAADDHIIIGTRGFEELGVSGKVNISATNRKTQHSTFVKMLSGFGGCNATALLTKTPIKEESVAAKSAYSPKVVITHRVHISPKGAVLDGSSIPVETDGGSLLTTIYKQKVGDYPKYYKMDALCRLGFLTTELLLQAEGKERFVECNDRAVVLFNHSSSIVSDRKYIESIRDKDNYYPSPSVFVYTLPNIVTGEIAIRNHYHGETSFYILQSKDERQMLDVQMTAFMDEATQSIISGWVDYEDESHFEADLYIVERKK